MKTVGQVVATHLDIMSEIKESLITDEERDQNDTQIVVESKTNDDNDVTHSSEPVDTALTFEEYRRNNISRSLNDGDNDKKCCNCDWNYCLAETW